MFRKPRSLEPSTSDFRDVGQCLGNDVRQTRVASQKKGDIGCSLTGG